MGFPRQEYWSAWPFPSSVDLPNPEIEPESPALAGGFFTTEPPGKSWYSSYCCLVAKSCPLFDTPWTIARQASPVFLYLPEFAQTHVHWVGDTIQPSHPLLPLLLLPSVFPTIRVFFNELALRIRWPKYWRFSISPSNEYSGLISFRIDWFDRLAVQGTLKSLFQHYSSKASVLRHSLLCTPTLTSLHDYWKNMLTRCLVLS